LEYENTGQQHPDADAVMEPVRGVLTAIACLAGCTPALVGGSPKWTLIVQNMADTMRNFRQVLKEKQLYRAQYGVHTEMLIRHRFWGNFGSLPGFGTVITFASFQDVCRCDSRMQ
jgi:hypothetical protein